MIPAAVFRRRPPNLLKLIPSPNVPASKDQPNYSGSGAVKFNDDAFNTRVDYYHDRQAALVWPLQPGELHHQLARNLRRWPAARATTRAAASARLPVNRRH